MSNNIPIELINNEEEINNENQWQGNFRIGEIDYDLLNHAFNIDNIYSYKIPTETNKHLVVTCLDQRPDFKLRFDLLPNFYLFIGSYSPDSRGFALTYDVYQGARLMIKTGDIPSVAREYRDFIYSLHGVSEENEILAYARFLQINGAECYNEKYKLTEGEKNWFVVRNYCSE
jgi:hypothetical protein